MPKVGLFTFESARKTPTGAVFRVTTLGESHEIVVQAEGDGLTAHVATGDLASARVPMTFSPATSSELHGPLDLPRSRDGGWSSGAADMAELKLAAGGDLASWFEARGARVTECHDGPCVHFPSTMLGAAALAVAALRLRPALLGHDFDATPPWVLPPAVGAISKASGQGGWGNSSTETVVGRLELYPKLLDAVADAVHAAGPCVEYGIVEHHFAYANVDDYRELHGMYGHLAVDHPMKWSMSGYLAMLLGRLSENDELLHRTTKGTGYWRYNSDISAWSLPGASSTNPVMSWSDFATSSLNHHPAEWPAAALLWGEVPDIARTWSGHVGPGEAPPGLQREDVPASVDDAARVEAFAKTFRAEAAFATDLNDIAARIRSHHQDGLGLPRDLGLLRAALAVECAQCPADDDYVAALLARMQDMF